MTKISIIIIEKAVFKPAGKMLKLCSMNAGIKIYIDIVDYTIKHVTINVR